jgi:hypothetical protein
LGPKFNLGVSFRHLVAGRTRQYLAQMAATESDTDFCLALAVLGRGIGHALDRTSER